jgi:hypothetical protein
MREGEREGEEKEDEGREREKNTIKNIDCRSCTGAILASEFQGLFVSFCIQILYFHHHISHIFYFQIKIIKNTKNDNKKKKECLDTQRF